MKRLAILGAALLCAAFSLVAHAQTGDSLCPVYLTAGSAGYTGAIANAPSSVYVKCAGSATTTCTPPTVLDPVTNRCVTPPNYCDASQISTPLGGKTFQRQCSGQMTLYPNGISGSGGGQLTDLGTLLGNKAFPNYPYSGQSLTFWIDSGYYVALAFTPTANGLIKFTANNSYGDGGTISLSTSPGILTPGAQGVICASSYGGLNSMIVGTSTGYCQVKIGQTYYLNFADTNASGDQLCFGGTAGTCAQSRVSYAFTARAQ